MAKVGVIKEGKIPPDMRTPMAPGELTELKDRYGVDVVVQSSEIRCFEDHEYEEKGISVKNDISDADILLGVKEVPVDMLIPEKTYFFFSHTIKKQPHNQKLLQAALKKKITLIDYECLTDKHDNRIIGFGRFAGIIGAYNGVLGYGKKYDLYHLKPAYECKDQEELFNELNKVKLPNIKILITGGGRAANGAIETLGALKVKRVTPYEFLYCSFREPVYCQLRSKDYHVARDGSPWNAEDFYNHPEKYVSTFVPYTRVTDLLIPCQYWDPSVPVLFTKDHMKASDFHISVIADISCDVNGAVPSTIRTSTIEDPFYGYNPITEEEGPAFDKETVTVMAVDNLPCELPRESSTDFGRELLERIIPRLFGNDPDRIIERATICKGGKLMPEFEYLSDYASGELQPMHG